MSCKVLTVVDERSRAFQLERSLNHFGWDFEIIRADWRGFGTKLNQVKEYLVNSDVEEFIFLDGYDTFCLNSYDNIKHHFDGKNSLISTEVNCWPDAERNKYFLHNDEKYRWKFPNSGTYYMKTWLFLELMNLSNTPNDCDDQRIMTDWVLNHNLNLDRNRDVFQTLCGILPSDFRIEESKVITELNTTPCFIHGNGKAYIEQFYNLIR
jgi:hypothetical protein